MHWFKSNWKWFVPIAILSCFVPVTTGILTAILLTCFVAIRSSKIFKLTVATVQTDKQVIHLLGSPITPGLLVLGNISRRASGTMVNLTIPLSGPQGNATVFAVASKKDDQWIFSSLQLQCKDHGPRINLLRDNPQ
jgi:hypothetical protein